MRSSIAPAVGLVTAGSLCAIFSMSSMSVPGDEPYVAPLAAIGLVCLGDAVVFAPRPAWERLSWVSGVILLGLSLTLLLLSGFTNPAGLRCRYETGPCFSPLFTGAVIFLPLLLGTMLAVDGIVRTTMPPGPWRNPMPPVPVVGHHPPGPSAPPGHAPGGTRKCPQCNREAPTAATFCDSCGAKLPVGP